MQLVINLRKHMLLKSLQLDISLAIIKVDSIIAMNAKLKNFKSKFFSCNLIVRTKNLYSDNVFAFLQVFPHHRALT